MKYPLFDAALIRRIIQNPVYSGKISYGRGRTEKVHGTRNEYRQVKKDDYLLVDGLHEALVSEEVWEQAQVKVAAQAKSTKMSIVIRKKRFIFYLEFLNVLFVVSECMATRPLRSVRMEAIIKIFIIMAVNTGI